ncbi:transglycosylase domain-containing protein [Pseudoxanthomonas sp. PXM01]|uniref:transglycosylase domain-containing protein n=1 Tax=Pseudoxanthomonas sp. PXM01 TaxID=2769295 RepID=UPI00177AC0DC|nr:transglycosylase domain-containing protein [Pseudoxanthomonas sp. PXM01]MBD9468464.1 transglycosylase domain-containing protein [Pseudoxanthomonas sp. PXM01]
MAWIRALLGTLLALAVLVVGLCFGLYAYGVSGLPDDLEPTRYRAAPELRALYLDMEAGGIEDVPRLNPLSVWSYGLWHNAGRQREPLGSQLRLLGHAGRALMIRREAGQAGATRWHLINLAATIEVSRHWRMDRMVDTLLAESGFGRNATGIEQAAHAWYRRPLAELVPEERLLLIALMKGPSYYDPCRNPERFGQRYRDLAARATGFDPDAALPRAVARLSPPDCAERLKVVATP